MPPWYIVPAEAEENGLPIISQVILDMLDGLKRRYPRPHPSRREELQSVCEPLVR